MPKELKITGDKRFLLFVSIISLAFMFGIIYVFFTWQELACISVVLLITIAGTLTIERLIAVPRQKRILITFTILSLIIGYFIVASNSSPTMPDYSNSSSTSSGGSWENGGKGKRINGAIPEFAECANKLNGQFSSVKKATEYCCRQIGGTMGGTYGGNCYK